MGDLIISKIFIYAFILLIGYTGKRLNAFKREHTKFLNNIICYITLPAALINGFIGLEITPILFLGFVLGLVTNILLLIFGQILTKNKTPNEKVIFVFSANCFNIGNFAIPFLAGLISVDGFAAICIFDISVALMCYGVNVAVANSIMGNEGKIKVKEVVKKICTSPVFITYILLIFISLIHFEIPKLVLDLTSVVGNANAFLAMLSIGILFQFKLSKDGWKIVFKLLSLRVVVCTIVVLITYYLLPFTIDVKVALCVVLMAPCPGAGPTLTESAGADGSISAVINSISIPLSIVLMTLLLMIL